MSPKTTRTTVENTAKLIAVTGLAALAGYTIVASGAITVPLLGSVPVDGVGLALLLVSFAVFVRQKRAAGGSPDGDCNCC